MKRARKWEFLFLLAAVSLMSWWRASVDWTHLYAYKLKDLAAYQQILTQAGIPNRISITRDTIEVDRSDIPRARAALAARRLPQAHSSHYLDRPIPIELETYKQELRDSVRCVPGVADPEVHIIIPPERAFAEPQDSPQVHITLTRTGPVDVDSVVHLAVCIVPEVNKRGVIVSTEPDRTATSP